ncbi:Integrase catalytic domain-containing protein [Aphis craccivora]|uniref:Integrase catalytic domain-containing protein n=1 Tax=Aphis craccivora TaxID=307492 RepID=A0A6G0YGW7_APHCR|nr:Integrase catalytic domain-containing protein [Aphis craccivora]
MMGSQASDTKIIISDIQSSNRTILNYVKLQSKEIDSCLIIFITTKFAIIVNGVERLNTEITGIFDENSLSNHGSYISDLNSRLKITEDRYEISILLRTINFLHNIFAKYYFNQAANTNVVVDTEYVTMKFNPKQCTFYEVFANGY